MRERSAALAIATALFLGGLAVLFGGVVMALAMGGHMGMMARGNNTPQTPVVSEEQAATVEMRSFEFFPRELTVKAGTHVTWLNKDAPPHDAAAGNKAWKTEFLQNGDSATLSFDTPGTYAYHCSVHPYMTATLTVRRGAH